jgi:hypothetical protein
MKNFALTALAALATTTTFAAADIRPVVRAATAPADLAVTYQRGPRAADEGAAELVELAPLDRKARTYRVTYSTKRFGKRTVVSSKVIGPAAADKFYTVVANADFFALQPSYDDPEVFDGASSSLTIRAGARTGSVTVSNVSVPAYGRVVVALHDL